MRLFFHATLGGPEERFRMQDWEVVGTPEWCCERLMDEWGVLVMLDVVGFPRPENLWVVLYVTHFTGADDILKAVVPITYCPWCGEWFDVRAENGRLNGKPIR